ncbi:MAG: DNA methyltransferase [Bacteroidota bacterium]
MSAPDDVDPAALDAFIERWKPAQAAELANAQPFLIELAALLGVPGPEPATKNPARDGYVFERPVDFQDAADAGTGRIDLYKRGCFVLETKQGVDAENVARAKGKGKSRSAGHGRRGTPAWDRTMTAAKRQAERYARNLDLDGVDEPVPPLVVACDVGYCLDLYANFGHPQRYVPFPDNRTYRVTLDDLREREVRDRLRLAWTDPDALDPARRQAEVTRELAETLGELAASLEASGAAPDDVFGFLSRCLFTMFAEDARLIPERSFSGLLDGYRDHLDVLPDALGSLWRTMDGGGYAPDLKATLRRFNGGLFAETDALPLDGDQLRLLISAAEANWREVEPAIFGTLLERALDPRERHKLGAHYTPRAYVERLVVPAVVDPLREEWDAAQAAVAQIEADAAASVPDGIKAREKHDRDTRRAVLAELRRYLTRLTSVRVLDPACGSGNFLYVTLEHLKRIEGEVQAALARYGVSGLDLEGAAVTPAQLLGIEVNPRAAAIADLVLWIGYLQWHLRTHDGPQGLSDPVLKAFGNIEQRDAVLAYDAKTPRLGEDGEPVTIWDGRTTKPHPATGELVPDPAARQTVYEYEGARTAEWPEADFVIGNPPFVGSKRIRKVLGSGYADALHDAYEDLPNGVDFVAYWWHKAALAVREGRAQAFGLITTSSIAQTQSRRVVAYHLAGDGGKKAPPPLALTAAFPDHPWVDDVFAAAVRVAMTVGVRGPAEGVVLAVELVRGSEDTPEDEPRHAEIVVERGTVYSDLRAGVDPSLLVPLRANEKVSHTGIQANGAGFEIDRERRREFEADGASHTLLKTFWGGTQIKKGAPRDKLVIDTFGLTEAELRDDYPVAYGHLYDTVKPERDVNNRPKIRDLWWIHAWERPEMRKATAGLSRYLGTVETSKHRYFAYLDADALANNSAVVLAVEDPYHFGVLSSRIHTTWAVEKGGRNGAGNDPRYTHTEVFQRFPFPDATNEQEEAISDAARRLDAHRTRVLAAHPYLDYTKVYNVLEAERAAQTGDGEPLDKKQQKVHRDAGVTILAQIHVDLDQAVADAYGWPVGLEPAEIVRRLSRLNIERQAEEAAGLVRYLRPAFQAPGETTQVEIDLAAADAEAAPAEPEPWPSDTAARALAIRRVLREADRPLAVEAVARRFRRAPRAAVADLLDTLATLGQARASEKGYAA